MSLFVLINDELYPEMLSNKSLAKFLGSIQDLSLDSLLSKISNSSCPKKALNYLNALIVKTADESTSSVNHIQSGKVLNCYFNLCDSLGLDIITFESSIINIYTRAIIDCKSNVELISLKDQVKQLGNKGLDISILNSALDFSYISDIFTNALNTSKEGILQSLEELHNEKNKEHNMDGVLEAIVMNTLQWINQTYNFTNLTKNNTNVSKVDSEYTKKMIIALNKLEIRDENLNKQVEDIINEFGYEMEINSLDQIEILGDPFKAYPNSDNTLTTYIYFTAIKKTRQKIAVKKITPSKGQKIPSRFNKEIETLRILSASNKNFLKFHGSFCEQNSLFILMEYVENSLKDYIKSSKSYSEMQFIDITKSLIEGFSFMASMKLFHHDIKPDNILITTEPIVPKIIDFGITVFDDQPKFNDTYTITAGHFVQGTQGYMSPEQKRAIEAQRQNPNAKVKKYDIEKSDVYSLGLTLTQMILKIDVSAYELEENNKHLLSRISTISSDLLKRVINKMVQLNPNSRPKFSQLLADFADITITVAN